MNVNYTTSRNQALKYKTLGLVNHNLASKAADIYEVYELDHITNMYAHNLSLGPRFFPLRNNFY